MHRIFTKSGITYVENLGEPTNIQIYNVFGHKLLEKRIQSGLTEIPNLQQNGVLIFSIEGVSYKVIL